SVRRPDDGTRTKGRSVGSVPGNIVGGLTSTSGARLGRRLWVASRARFTGRLRTDNYVARFGPTTPTRATARARKGPAGSTPRVCLFLIDGRHSASVTRPSASSCSADLSLAGSGDTILDY